MAMQGMDTTVIQELLNTFRTQIEAVNTVVSAIDTAISTHIGDGKTWAGPDANQFDATWNGEQRNALMRVVEFLELNVTTVTSNREAQTSTSAS